MLEIIDWDGKVELKDVGSCALILTALCDPTVQVVAIHKPGSEVYKDDIRYRVREDGKWEPYG